MLHAARRASSKRREVIEEMKKKESEDANRSKTTLETVNKLEAKKRKLLQQAEEEASALQTEIDLEKKRLKQMCRPFREIAGEKDKQVGRVERSVKGVTATRELRWEVGSPWGGSVQFEELILTGMSMSGQPSSESSERTTNGEKLSKKEGNLDCGGQKPKESKTSRRTTSLLNLFMSNSQGSKECSGNPEGGSLPTSAPTSPTGRQGTEVPSNGHASSLARNPLRGSKWFLRSRRDKRKEKKSKKKKDGSDSMSNKEDKSDVDDKEERGKSDTPTPEVDEEGYCIRPKVENWENDKASFYSSSDTDSGKNIIVE
uniref:Uncharacterized protein n=1 Tax=Timema monikensis TaxID=170555 RepID=A0A7R9HLM8_9NEOP|nr:unnamed protein product [Timema monikensis]